LTEVVPSEFRADLIVLLVDGRPVLAIVVEVQLSRDERKRFTWPVYLAGVRARFECPAVVLVVTSTENVARWAGMPISFGPGTSFQVLVIGPEDVRVAVAALAGCLGLEDERGLLYSDLLRVLLGEATRSALETLMQSRGYEYQSEFARKHTAVGEARGEARAVLTVLDARGLAVSPTQRDRLLSCTDLAALEQWVRRAVTVASTDELFA
jgi:hypothetical protein